MNNREQVIKNFTEKNRKAELNQAKLRAKSRLEGLDDSEKEVLTTLKNLADKSSMKTIKEMLTLIDTAMAD